MQIGMLVFTNAKFTWELLAAEILFYIGFEKKRYFWGKMGAVFGVLTVLSTIVSYDWLATIEHMPYLLLGTIRFAGMLVLSMLGMALCYKGTIYQHVFLESEHTRRSISPIR